MLKNPEISVVIPCYNAGSFLGDAIKSVLAQHYPVLEVIVIDDGSTDESANTAELFAPKVRLIRQQNSGESVARNRGIDEARGDWVAFLDADDWWLPDKLAEQIKRITPEVDAICCGATAVYPDGRELSVIPQSYFLQRGWIMEHGAPCHISTLMIRRCLPTRFPVWTSFAEDLLFFLDLMGTTSIAIAPLALSIYRIHAGGQTQKPDMAERRNASLTKWLELNKDKLPTSELTALLRAQRRRVKWHGISQALKLRSLRKPRLAIIVYTKVLLSSFYSSTSWKIVYTAARSLLGTFFELFSFCHQPSDITRISSKH